MPLVKPRQREAFGTPETSGRARRSLQLPYNHRMLRGTELFQPFSLMGQARDSSRPLREILADFGVEAGVRIGCVGWKSYSAPLVEDPEHASEIPAYLVDALRVLAVDPANVVNANAIFMDVETPEVPLRTADFRTLQPPCPVLTVTDVRERDAAVSFTVSSDKHAHAVHFGFDDRVRLSDEFFDLLPGESRRITVIPGDFPFGVADIKAGCVHLSGRETLVLRREERHE